jgi:hypothetical protein
MKEWYEEQPFRVKVVVRPRAVRSDLVWAAVIIGSWIPTLFSQKVPGMTKVGLGILMFYIAITTYRCWQAETSVNQLGNLLTRYLRQEHSALNTLDQITSGDDTVIVGATSRPGKNGQWRTVSWLEADTAEVLTKGDINGPR